MLLSLLHSRWPETSRQLHEDGSVKPFTLSPVMVTEGRNRQRSRLGPGTLVSIRITCLAEELMERLIDTVIRLSASTTVTIGDAPFHLNALVTTAGVRHGCRMSTFHQLVEEAKPVEQFSLRFASPTTFRSGGQRNVVFPSPRLVFNSLLGRWNQYSPESLKLSLPNPDDLVTPQTYKLSTRVVDFGSYQERGFVGTCQYALLPNADDDLIKTFAILSEFAYFAGVGAKTTMGMGQCWRIAV